MFERFTGDARAVVQGAVGHAEAARAPRVDPGHLLLALLDRESGRCRAVLAALGVGAERKESVRRDLADTRRRAGLSRADSDALAGLGIDVTEIVARVEEAHGVGAMSGDRRAGRGRRPFTPDAKDVLARALRAAGARGDRHIGDEHLLLALVTRPGGEAEILHDHGVTHETVTQALHDGGAESRAS
ncbi:MULTISPECIES: Clp protease N-terminal domain-containing protein [unclassified Streptomyces]|uniref:Clp protease N-terminal domain-containing protein n=1 Tax=unclassified Streptomyces TaxID=2593676 RepID=UPI003325B610